MQVAVRNAVLLALMFAANYFGFACLALGQRRHWISVVQQPLASRAWVLRGIGLALLIASFGLSIWRGGGSFGSVLWCTFITIGAMAVAFTLSWWPGWLRPFAGLFQRRPAEITPTVDD